MLRQTTASAATWGHNYFWTTASHQSWRDTTALSRGTFPSTSEMSHATSWWHHKELLDLHHVLYVSYFKWVKLKHRAAQGSSAIKEGEENRGQGHQIHLSSFRNFLKQLLHLLLAKAFKKFRSFPLQPMLRTCTECHPQSWIKLTSACRIPRAWKPISTEIKFNLTWNKV